MKPLAHALALVAWFVAHGLTAVSKPATGTGECVAIPDGGSLDGGAIRFEGWRFDKADGGTVRRYYVGEVQLLAGVDGGEDARHWHRVHASVRRHVATVKHPECWLWITRAEEPDSPSDCRCGPDCFAPSGVRLGRHATTYVPGAWRLPPDGGTCVPSACAVLAGDPDPEPASCR